jgi:hypothetical protein
MVFALCQASYADWSIAGVKSVHTALRLAFSSLSGREYHAGVLEQSGKRNRASPCSSVDLPSTVQRCGKLLVPFFMTTPAEVYGLAGDPQKGLDSLAEAAALVDATQER